MMPILFHIGDSPVYSYPLLMGIGWGMAYNLSVEQWLKAGLRQSTLRIFVILSFLIGWIGAKVFFLIFSTPDKVFYYAKEVNFWLGGGFVFYGGFVFVALFGLLFFSLRKDLCIKDLGLLIPGICVGHAIGRVGCFLAGCCYGSETHSSFSVMVEGHSRYPVQLIESAGLMIIYLMTKKSLSKNKREVALYLYLISYSLLRFGNEFLRGDEIRGLYYGLATSQWISMAILTIATIFFLKGKRLKN